MTITTNYTATGASSAPLASNNPPHTQEWSLIDIVQFCNKANLSGIQFQSASMQLMSNKMYNTQTFQNDCNGRTQAAEAHSKTMEGLNIAMTVFSIVTAPVAIALSCAVGPEVFGVDVLVSSAVQGLTSSATAVGVDVASGVASATLGTGLAVTQVQLGQDEQSIQTDTAAIQNGGDQVKQLSDAVTDIMKAEQVQGQIVGATITNTSQASSVYKHKES
jgi:hypothetical protein